MLYIAKFSLSLLPTLLLNHLVYGCWATAILIAQNQISLPGGLLTIAIMALISLYRYQAVRVWRRIII